MGQLIHLGGPRKATAAARPARVLLVSPSYALGPNTSYFPIGLAYISSFIRSFGHEVVALNMNHFTLEQRYAELDRLLRSEQLDVVGITGLTVAFNEIDKIVKFVRARSAAQVVLGGGITSCESELVMETIHPDFMVVSEGELIFRDLLDALQSGSSTAEIKGLWSWVDGRPAYLGEGPSVSQLDELPFPDMELFGIREYLTLQAERQIDYHETRFEPGKAIPITASRSCPYRCTFCYHAGMGSYRRHSMTNVVDNIQRLITAVPEATHISIYDELFSANKKRIYEFCDLLEQRNIKVSWYCQLRVDQLEQALLDRMRQSGCRHISYGFESGSDVILDSMDKKIKARQIAAAVKMTRQAKIGIQANFLFGDPAETEETLQETLRFQQENQLHFVDWSAVIPYPGTRVYNFALDKGLIQDREKFIRSMCNISGYLWNNMINMTTLSDEDYQAWYVRLRELNDQNHRQRPVTIARAQVVDHTRSRMNLVCPHCGKSEDQVIPYPPETSRGPANLRAPIGMIGLNIVCGACNRKAHLKARDIPHVAAIFDDFQRALDRFKQAGTEVVVLPALDRYLGVFGQDIDLQGLPVAAVLDSRPKRVGVPFLGRATEAFTPEAVARHRARPFVILPWVEYERALSALQEAGVPRAQILCWNDRFGDHLRGDAEPAARAAE
jgi:anaerobic magnesium-protoporphyrin IX monomethyl ester cyclase